MKKLLLLPFIVLFVVSCSEDDNVDIATPITESTIVGKWMVTAKETEAGETVPLWNCEHHSYIQFNANETFLRMKFMMSEGNCVEQNMSDTNMKYNLNGTVLTMTYDDIAVGPITDTGNIIELTSTKLKMAVEFHDDSQDLLIVIYTKVAQ